MNDALRERTTAAHWHARLIDEIDTAPTPSAAAGLLIRQGITVFPCAPGGKQPLTRHGFQDATVDPAIVSAWWRRWPDANVAIPTGSASKVDVVDVDVHPGGTGFDAFERARQAGYAKDWAWLVRTPSGGVHAYFPRGASPEQRSWQVPGAHIDFRGDGGYILIPPSVVAGEDGVSRPYSLIAIAQHHQPRPVDGAALRGFLDPPRPPRPTLDAPAAGSRPEQLAAWVAERQEGGRNSGLFWAACRMAEQGHDLSTATSVLGDAACATGLPEREALTTIRSAYRTSRQSFAVPHVRARDSVEAVRL